jgi:hypothetical protein
MQIASFLHRIVLSSVECLAVPYLSTLSQTARFFGWKKQLLYIKCVATVSLQRLHETFLIFREFGEILP